MITISVSHKPLADHDVQGYIVFVEQDFSFDNYPPLAEFTRFYSPLKELITQRQFTGGLNATCVIPINNQGKPSYLILAGVGSAKSKKADRLEHLRRAVGNVVRICETAKINHIGIQLPDTHFFDADALTLGQEIASIFMMAAYHFNDFITEKSRVINQAYTITLVAREEDEAGAKIGVELGQKIGFAVNRARYWCDLPPSNLIPHQLAQHARGIAESHGLKCTIFNEDEIIKMGMGGIEAVARGSEKDAQFVIMEYKSEYKDAPTIALVGKGITFDSGGLSIKPATAMETMKDDMAGAAVVISTMDVVAHIKPRVNVIAFAPLAENLISGHATKPGDIAIFYNGKTAEIKNTDAEGRLILADAMSYAVKHYKLDAMVTIATLTGACAYALGPLFAGLMSQDDELTQKVIDAGEASGDRVWELPMHDDYKVAIRSKVADMANIGSDQYRAGAITAAFFLQNFSGTVPWVHLDIAGTAFAVPDKSYYRHDATGFGTRLFVQLLSKW